MAANSNLLKNIDVSKHVDKLPKGKNENCPEIFIKLLPVILLHFKVKAARAQEFFDDNLIAS